MPDSTQEQTQTRLPTAERSRLDRTIPRLALAIVATAYVFTPGMSFAQMGYQACSLEWLVADSDAVVRASVAEVSPSESQAQRVWKTVTLKVHETLKGD